MPNAKCLHLLFRWLAGAFEEFRVRDQLGLAGASFEDRKKFVVEVGGSAADEVAVGGHHQDFAGLIPLEQQLAAAVRE